MLGKPTKGIIVNFKLLITVFVACFISACASTRHTLNTIENEEIVKFQNIWKKGEFITSNYKNVISSSRSKSESDELWVIEPIPNKSLVRIRSKNNPHHYLHIENGELELGLIEKGWLSAQWAIINHGSYSRIKNAWKVNNYINIEHNGLQASPIKDGWHSAMWNIEVLN